MRARFFAHFVTALVVSAGAAWAQTPVTFSGTIASLDSTRANMTMQTPAGSRVIILPTQVEVRRGSASGPLIGVNGLTLGSQVTVDGTRTPHGLTAQRVVVMTGPATEQPPAGPPAANQVTVQPAQTQPTGFQVRTYGGTVRGTPSATGAVLMGNVTGEVVLNRRTLFRFRATRDFNPQQRAQIVADRLNALDRETPLRPAEVRAVQVNGQWSVMARNAVIITADTRAARANRTTPYRLAQLWAQNLRNALRLR